jgi:hypothetical protein
VDTKPLEVGGQLLALQTALEELLEAQRETVALQKDIAASLQRLLDQGKRQGYNANTPGEKTRGL